MHNDAELSLDQVKAFANKIKTGDTLVLKWATKEDPDTIFTWECVVQTVAAGRATFTSRDADDPLHVFDLPSVVYEPDDDEITDALVDLVYYDLRVKERPVRKTMAQMKTRSLARSTICAWKVSTWRSLLGDGMYGREIVTGELFRQFGIPERMNQQRFTENEEFEACTLGEILLGAVDLMRAVTDEVRDSPQMDALLRPLIGRLCELKAGQGKKGAERTKAMNDVRKVIDQTAHHGDKLTQAMLGHTSGGGGT